MYFKVHSIPQNERLEFVMPHVEGPALQWFIWSTDRYVLEDWDDFKIQLGRRFRDLLSYDIMEQFLEIKQKGLVKEYKDEFERLLVYLPPILEAIMMKTFAKGLTKGIKVELSRGSFKDLRELIDTTFKIEKIMQAVYESYHEQYFKEAKPPHPYTKTPRQTHPWRPTYKHACSTTNGKIATLPTAGRPRTEGDSMDVSSKGFIPYTKRKLMLTTEEVQNRREKGLCYHCNEKLGPCHHCKKTLQIMIVAEDEAKQNERELAEIPEWEFSEEVSETQLLSANVSLNSMLGLANTKSIMIKGALQGKEIMILIDSGASHNFLRSSLVSEFHLPCNQSVQFEVTLGNGQIDKGQGLCEAVHYSLQGIDITTNFLSYSLKGVDMILGMAWLYSLGWKWLHWQKCILKFLQGGETITLQGDQSLYKTKMSINEANKELTKSQLFMVELHQIYQVAPHTQSKLAIALEDKLKSGFPKVFAPLTELPTPRAVDHSIPLVLDAQPVNLRPYMYSHVQKNEIEKLVHELLDLEFIRPSHSPFSSPVLLIKKKDAGWRFCVAYRALNKITVPNRYPIPIVEELLDELHGAVIFSNLDLKLGYHQIRMTDQDRHKTAFKTDAALAQDRRRTEV